MIVLPVRPKVKLFGFWTRRNPLRILTLPLLAVATIVMWVIGGSLCFIAIHLVTSGFSAQSAPQRWTIMLSMVAGLAPTVLCFKLAEIVNAFFLRKLRKVRCKRLMWISCRDDAATRAPHRLIELIQYTGRRKWSATRRILREIPSNVVVCNIHERRKTNSIGPHHYSSTPFEPADLQTDYTDAFRLQEMLCGESEHIEQHVEQVKQQQVSFRGRARTSFIWFRQIAVILLVTGWLYFSSANWAIPVAIILSFTAFRRFFPHPIRGIAETKWWLVPGGIIMCKRRAWQKHQSVTLLTPSDTPLYIFEDRSTIITVRHGHKFRVLTALPQTSGLIGMGWMSSAPAPTKEEVLSFIGPDAVFEE